VIIECRNRGESRYGRIVVRLPERLWTRLSTYAPDCPHASAVAVLADEGLRQLIESKQRLISPWIPGARNGQFHHLLRRQERGTPRVEDGSIPRRFRAHTAMISLPDELHETLRSQGRHVSTALAALADWQLNLLIEGREQIIVESVKQPRPSRI
jgi:hypothetical protein